MKRPSIERTKPVGRNTRKIWNRERSGRCHSAANPVPDDLLSRGLPDRVKSALRRSTNQSLDLTATTFSFRAGILFHVFRVGDAVHLAPYPLRRADMDRAIMINGGAESGFFPGITAGAYTCRS